jgi:hypothetical protein
MATEETKESPLEELPTEEPATAEPVVITEEQIAVVTEVPAIETQQDILLDQSFWTQDQGTVFVAYMFENPNSNYMLEEGTINFYLLDSTGTEIGSDWYDIYEVLPLQKFAIVFTYYLSDEQAVVDSISIDWDTTMTQTSGENTPDLFIYQSNYWPNNGYPGVTGGIMNQSQYIYTNLRVNIVCFDNAGRIVGGNYTYVDFVPDYNQIGFSSYVETYGEVASTEIYPLVTSSTEKVEATDQWSKLILLEDNFYQGSYGWVYGGTLIYNDTQNPITDSVFYATFYDSSGRVVSSGYDYIDFIFPGQTLGLAPWIYSLPDNTSISYSEIWLLPGEEVSNYELSENPFQVTSLGIIGDYKDTVSVTFTNTYNKDASELDVFVLLRNTSGEIIGGGYDWTSEPTLAGGSTTIEIWVSYDSAESIDTIEAWVMPNYWTEFD